MLVEINKIYIMSAPKATDGMTPGKDDFIEGKANGTYVKMKKINDGDMVSLSKVFNHKDLLLQAVMFVTDLPIQDAKNRINTKIHMIINQKDAPSE